MAAQVPETKAKLSVLIVASLPHTLLVTVVTGHADSRGGYIDAITGEEA